MSGWIAVVSTAYCLGGVMADGTPVRAGSVASNSYALGTRVTVSRSPTRRERFVVRDRIGWGTQLDFWLPSCAQARAWGRRIVRIRQGWRHRRAIVRRSYARSVSGLRLLADPDPAHHHPDPAHHGRQPRLISASSWPSSAWSSWPW